MRKHIPLDTTLNLLPIQIDPQGLEILEDYGLIEKGSIVGEYVTTSDTTAKCGGDPVAAYWYVRGFYGSINH